MKTCIALLSGLLFFLDAFAASHPRYRVEEVPLPAGATESFSTAINDNGDVVMACSVGVHARVFILPRNGFFQDIGTLPGRDEMSFGSMNNLLQVVGLSYGYGVAPIPFLYDGILQPFQNVGGEFVRTADHINDHGVIVGTLGNAPYHTWASAGFVYSNGIIHLLPGAYTANPFLATALNERGMMAGIVAEGPSSHAALYVDGGLDDFGASLGKSYATDINDEGAVTGWINKDGHYRGFVYRNGKLKRLGLLPRHRSLSPFAINNSGQIVGRAGNDTGDDIAGFLWNNGTLINLNHAVVQSQLRIEMAQDINHGVIVASVRFAGVLHTVILTPIRSGI